MSNKNEIGGNPLPLDAQEKLSEFIDCLDTQFEIDQGATALYWEMSANLANTFNKRRIHNMKFDEWFIEEQIHEVINSRADLVVEILNDVQVGKRSMRYAHKELTTLLEQAFEAGKKSNV